MHNQKCVELNSYGFINIQNSCNGLIFIDNHIQIRLQPYIILNLAEAHAAKGNKAKARKYYKKATEVNTASTDYRFWQAKAHEALGDIDKAKALYEALRRQGADGIVTDYVSFYGAEGTTGNSVEAINTKALYTKALGEIGLGNKDVARADLTEAVRLKRDNLWAVNMLKSLE